MINQTIKWRLDTNSGDLSGYSSLTFSPDGRYLAAWDNGFSLFVWDMLNGEVVHQIRFNRDDSIFATSISISPDGQLLALASYNSPTLIYSMITGERIDTFPSPNIVTYPPTDSGDHFLIPGHHFGEIINAVFLPNDSNVLAIGLFVDPFVGHKNRRSTCWLEHP
jgi:WD40 repeat protein